MDIRCGILEKCEFLNLHICQIQGAGNPSNVECAQERPKPDLSYKAIFLLQFEKKSLSKTDLSRR